MSGNTVVYVSEKINEMIAHFKNMQKAIFASSWDFNKKSLEVAMDLIRKFGLSSHTFQMLCDLKFDNLSETLKRIFKSGENNQAIEHMLLAYVDLIITSCENITKHVNDVSINGYTTNNFVNDADAICNAISSLRELIDLCDTQE